MRRPDNGYFNIIVHLCLLILYLISTLEHSAVPHSWYALGVLHAEAAIQPLIRLLGVNQYRDVIYDTIPFVLGLIGPAAIPDLDTYLIEHAASRLEFDVWAAEESLYWIARRHPDCHERCITLLMRQLNRYAQRDATGVRYLMRSLIQLHAVEALPLLEQVAEHMEDADIEMTGDWFHIQYLFGLLSRQEADQRRLDYWHQRDLEEFGYPIEHSLFEYEGYQPFTWLDNAPDFDKRGNVDRALVKTRAARWAYKLTQGWFYGPFAVMALTRLSPEEDSPILAIAIIDEQGHTLLDTLVDTGITLSSGAPAQADPAPTADEVVPSFPAIHPQVRAVLHERSLVMYDEADRELFDHWCSVYQIKSLQHGFHEAKIDYAYYYGQLNAERNACIIQSLAAACKQQHIAAQPGLVGQCRMLLGLIQSMADWLAGTALPEVNELEQTEF